MFRRVALLLLLFSSNAFAASQVYSTATSTTWVVPDGVTSITVKSWGGGGGGAAGGSNAGSSGGAGGGGGFSQAVISVTPGETLNVYVGGGGGAGGQSVAGYSGQGGGGGGYTAITRSGSYLIVAGGGGGGGGGDNSSATPGGAGGVGGGAAGGSGAASGNAGGGGGGSDSAPGAGGASTNNAGSAGSGSTGGGGADGQAAEGADGSGPAGGLNGGGAGGTDDVGANGYGGGGGGAGGYYGGGGGGGSVVSNAGGGGGGGGSCYVTGSSTSVTQASGATAANNTDSDYTGSAGQGGAGGAGGTTPGNGTAGTAGCLVIKYAAPGAIATVNHGDGNFAVGFPHQRKVARDSNGYWYAVWMDYNGSRYEIFMSKSTNTTGNAWAPPVELAGDAGIIYTEATYGFYYPSIDIDRTNGRLHIVFARMEATGSDVNDIVYSRCSNLANWNQAGSWYQINGTSNGYTTVATNSFQYNTVSTYGPSVAADGSGNVHVAWMRGTNKSPYYAYGTTSFATEVAVDTTSYWGRYPTIEVDSNNVVHYVWVKADSGSIYRYVYESSASSPYTSFSAKVARVDIASHHFGYPSMAADDEGNVHIVCEDDTDADVAGAYFNGSTWTEFENIDILGWDKPMVGVRAGSGVTNDIIVSPRDTTDPDSLYYWKWDGASWGQHHDTLKTADSFISLEKRTPANAGDMGYIYFDASTGSGEIYFSRILFSDTQTSHYPADRQRRCHRAAFRRLHVDDGRVFADLTQTPRRPTRGTRGSSLTTSRCRQAPRCAAHGSRSTFEGTTYDDINCVIYGNDVDSAGTFTTTAFDISSEARRPRTTASVAWQQDALLAGWKNVEVTNIVREITERPGWQSGQNLALLFIANSDVSKDAQFSVLRRRR